MSIGRAQLTKPAPDFQATALMPDGQFKQLRLSDYKGKYLVFFFYPMDFTYICPTEIIAFSDRIEEYKKINCEVMACSVDSHMAHQAWVGTARKDGGLGQITIPLLSDPTHAISRSYGVYKEDAGVAFRGLFIIDASGMLRQVTVNDLQVGRSVDETMRLVLEFQQTDKYGETCPVRPQDPEPTKSRSSSSSRTPTPK
ncbi:peroxiredoxin-like [Ambystoma mexicanum]|uniref:peroxiredoxin-like n=1 Tax=Ambystoma mexicanum TaxID=8296 RepID=UPI0037E971A7